jgi:hypothetical protein
VAQGGAQLTGRAHASARRESKKKMYFAEYAKGARGPSGSMKGTVACGRGGLAW